MDIRSGVSLWPALHPPTVFYPTLAEDVRCEVVVVGAGITGALVAERLIREGVATVVIDRAAPASGSTAASTGLLQYEIDAPLCQLIDLVGEESAVFAYQRGLDAIAEVAELAAAAPNHAGFAHRTSWYFASHRWHERKLKREYECRRQHGFDVQYLDRKAIADRTSLRAAAAILSSGDAQIDPYRFTCWLLEHTTTQGLRLFANTPALEINEHPTGVIVRTPSGTITAERIVYASGYEAHQHLKHPVGNLNSTYVVTSQPLSSFAGWPENSLVWETARPYFYARLTDDGRAMIGGEDTIFHDDHQRDGLVERKVDQLVGRFNKLFPAIDFIPAFAWAGTFADTKDGLPYIGQLPNRPRAYFALGYGGNGITFSMIAADIIADLFHNRQNIAAHVFRFGR